MARGSAYEQEDLSMTARVENEKYLEEEQMMTQLSKCLEYFKEDRGRTTFNRESMSIVLDWDSIKDCLRIISKNRDILTWKPMRKLLSERDTWYENVTNKDTTYTFKSSFEESQSVTVGKKSRFTVQGGVKVSGNIPFTDVGATADASYSKQQSKGTKTGTTRIREQTVNVAVPAKSAVCIKQLLYEVEHEQMCVVQVTLHKDKTLLYRYEHKGSKEGTTPTNLEWKMMTVGTLITEKSKVEAEAKKYERKDPSEGKKAHEKKTAFDSFKVDGNFLTITFKSHCITKTRENRLQTEKLKMTDDRVCKLTERKQQQTVNWSYI